MVRSYCEVEVPDDGMRFDTESVTSTEIRLETLCDEQRLKVIGYLGTARLQVQIDVGFGDAVVPGPIWVDYPELLCHGPPRLRACTLESAVAEKYQAMVDLGAFNSRMKDFFDVWWLSRNKAFEGPRLAGAIEATFERRRTDPPPDVPIALTEAFADRAAEEQWRAFVRMRLGDEPPELEAVIEALHAFLRAH